MKIKKGESIRLKINGYAFEGKGIAKVEIENPQNTNVKISENKISENKTNENKIAQNKKFVVFVEGAYPGDEVIARITKKRSSYANAKVEKIIVPATDRIEPKCKYFRICGGCKQQDLHYEKQAEFKQQQVKELFLHMGGLENYISEPILKAERIYFYRNKMEFSFADKRWIMKSEIENDEGIKKDVEIKNRDFALGMHIPRIFDKVLDLEECFLQSEISAEIVNLSRQFFVSKNIKAYSTKTHTGFLRNLVIRQSHFTKDLMVNIVTASENEKLMQEYSEKLVKKFPEITTIINNVNLKKAQVAIGDFEKTYFGTGKIYDSIGDYKFRISANSFFQTNTLQAEKLYSTAVEFAEFQKDDIVYDLYSGAGTISIFISGYVKKVYALENVEAAVTDASANLKLNQIENVEFIQADLNHSFLPIVEQNQLPMPDVIIADPPRSGMNPKTVKDILKLSPKTLVYVSCNPATQVRDIKLLIEGGFKLIKTKPVDMFPQTFHIENVALLRRT